MDPENGAEMGPKWSRNGPRCGPKMVATANASAGTRLLRNGRKHCATATLLQKWTPKMEQKWTPEMEQKWTRNGAEMDPETAPKWSPRPTQVPAPVSSETGENIVLQQHFCKN